MGKRLMHETIRNSRIVSGTIKKNRTLTKKIQGTDKEIDDLKIKSGRTILPGELTCGYECHTDDVFGFVPEADCPVHDK